MASVFKLQQNIWKDLLKAHIVTDPYVFKHQLIKKKIYYCLFIPPSKTLKGFSHRLQLFYNDISKKLIQDWKYNLLP